MSEQQEQPPAVVVQAQAATAIGGISPEPEEEIDDGVRS